MPSCYYIVVPREQRKTKHVCAVAGRQEGESIMKKFCTKCGHEFEAVGREVICPACKEHAAEEAKRTAVLRAKKASWTGESVPVRISGRASTVIRRYGAANNLPFAQALDELLKASAFFRSAGKAWEEVEPYRSHRRDKRTTEAQDAQTAQEVKTAQDGTQAPEKPQEVKQAAKQASKATTSKATNKAAGKAASKASASKASASKK